MELSECLTNLHVRVCTGNRAAGLNKTRIMKVSNNSVSVLFMLFSVLFCVCLITANVLETKQISIGWVNING